MDKTFFEIRNPERIDALLSEYQWMKLLKNRGHKYEMLLDYMIDLGEYESMDETNQESKRREVTKISKTLGISPQIISGWLHEIYNDIWELNYETPKLFQKKEEYSYELYLGSDYNRASFSLSLPVKLNMYDCFIFKFAMPRLNCTSFDVKRIYFNHEYGDIHYSVHLSAGRSNIYRDILFHKAVFMGAISHYDRNHTAERDIDEMLREYERNNIITESESSKKWHEKYGCF